MQTTTALTLLTLFTQQLRLVCAANHSTHPVQSACSPNNPTQSHIELHNSTESAHIEPHQAELDERIDEEQRKGTIFVVRVGSPMLYSDLQKVILPPSLPATCSRFTCSDSRLLSTPPCRSCATLFPLDPLPNLAPFSASEKASACLHLLVQ